MLFRPPGTEGSVGVDILGLLCPHLTEKLWENLADRLCKILWWPSQPVFLWKQTPQHLFREEAHQEVTVSSHCCPGTETGLLVSVPV